VTSADKADRPFVRRSRRARGPGALWPTPRSPDGGQTAFGHVRPHAAPGHGAESGTPDTP